MIAEVFTVIAISVALTAAFFGMRFLILGKDWNKTMLQIHVERILERNKRTCLAEVAQARKLRELERRREPDSSLLVHNAFGQMGKNKTPGASLDPQP